MAGEKLVCFDFDQTMVNSHFHSTLMRLGVKPNERKPGVQVRQPDGSFLRTDPVSSSKVVVPTGNGAPAERIQEVFDGKHGPMGAKHGDELVKAIKMAIDNGHKVAIVSFTLYPEVAEHALRNILGADADKYIPQICIVGGFPSDNKPDSTPLGKEEHISAAISHFAAQGTTIDRNDAVLLDDSSNNIKVSNAKYPTAVAITVPKEVNPENKSYFNELEKIISVKASIELSVSADASRSAPVDASLQKENIQATIIKALNEQSGTKSTWELRFNEKTAVSDQVVSPLMSKEQAFQLAARAPGANVFKSRGDTGLYRVALDLNEASKNLISGKPLVSENTASKDIKVDRVPEPSLPPELEALSALAQEKTSTSRPPAIAPQRNRAIEGKQHGANATKSLELAVDKGKVETYKTKPGNIYLVFGNESEMNAANALLAQQFGKDATRIAGQKNTIQISPDIKAFIDQRKTAAIPTDPTATDANSRKNTLK
jgi:hypothetical protein